MIKRLLVGIAAGLCSLLPFAGSPASAHEPSRTLDGWESAFVHLHVYDCAGSPNLNLICVDPTTGYGPVLWMCNLTNCSWSTGITAAATATFGDFDETDFPNNYAWYADSVSRFYYGPFSIGVPGYITQDGTCNVNCGYATMSQSVFNQVTWIINSSGIYYIRFVH